MPTLLELPGSEFDSRVGAVVTEKLQEEYNLFETTNRFWNEISDRRYHFNRKLEEAEALRGLQQASFAAWCAKLLGEGSARSLQVHVDSCKYQEEAQPSPGPGHVVNAQEWRAQQRVYPYHTEAAPALVAGVGDA